MLDWIEHVLELNQVDKVERFYSILEGDLEGGLERYFEDQVDADVDQVPIPFLSIDKSKALLSSDIKMVLRDPVFKTHLPTARSIARYDPVSFTRCDCRSRILHGISSPKFRAMNWKHNGLWGKRKEFCFSDIMKLCSIVIKSRMKDAV